jgi:hypothetical protein
MNERDDAREAFMITAGIRSPGRMQPTAQETCAPWKFRIDKQRNREQPSLPMNLAWLLYGYQAILFWVGLPI